jgi:excisionase family DNA binding protein
MSNKTKSGYKQPHSLAELARGRGHELLPNGEGGYKVRDAAEFLSLSIPTVHRLVARGLLKANRATRHLLFSRSELDRF